MKRIPSIIHNFSLITIILNDPYLLFDGNQFNIIKKKLRPFQDQIWMVLRDPKKINSILIRKYSFPNQHRCHTKLKCEGTMREEPRIQCFPEISPEKML